MKIYLLLFALLMTTFSMAQLTEQDKQQILGPLHKAGITKCDKYIVKEFEVFWIPKKIGIISVQVDPKTLDGIKTATVNIIYEGKDSTYKNKYIFTQTQNNCYSHMSAVSTTLGPCAKPKGGFWDLAQHQAFADYTADKSYFGPARYQKEITMGNAKLCIKEWEERREGP